MHVLTNTSAYTGTGGCSEVVPHLFPQLLRLLQRYLRLFPLSLQVVMLVLLLVVVIDDLLVGGIVVGIDDLLQLLLKSIVEPLPCSNGSECRGGRHHEQYGYERRKHIMTK